MRSVLDLPSLKHMTLANISVLLWKYHCNISINCKKMATSKKKKQWIPFQEAVCKLVDIFVIPDNLKPILCTLVQHIGRELWDLLNFLVIHVFNSVKFLEMKLVKSIISCTQWSIHGKLDMTKTVRVILQLEDLTVKTRFDIACLCCVAEVIEDVWNEFSDVLKKDFDKKEADESDLKIFMYKFWKKLTVKTNTSNLPSAKKMNMFFLSITHKNQCAVEYFWSIMKLCERNAVVKLLVQKETKLHDLIYPTVDSYGNASNDFRTGTFETGILDFLFSQMNEQQIHEFLFSEEWYGFRPFLPFLLDFMDVESFNPTLQSILKSVTGDEFYDIINRTDDPSSEVMNCLTDLWINSPAERKICYNDHKFSFLFPRLCSMENVENMDLLLRNESVKNRMKILSRSVALATHSGIDSRVSILPINWEFMEFMAKKYLTINQEMKKFKKYCCFLAYDICCALTRSRENQWPIIDRVLTHCFENVEEISKFKKCLAFNYFTNYQTKGPLFMERFLHFLDFTSSDDVISHLVAKDILENYSVLCCLRFCLKRDMKSIELLFKDVCVTSIRRILFMCFYKMVARTSSDIKWDWNFITLVASKLIEEENEMMIFKQNCQCMAYKVCFDGLVKFSGGVPGPIWDNFLNFCYSNTSEISYLKKCVGGAVASFWTLLVDHGTGYDTTFTPKLYMMFKCFGFTEDETSDILSIYL
uniref:Uncharacterized protein n=1 Tax=Strigamia maritima TaxID=126957 RepID=T1JF87_STRMM